MSRSPTLARLLYLFVAGGVCAIMLTALFLTNWYVAVEHRRFGVDQPKQDCRQVMADELVGEFIGDSELCDADALLFGSSRLRVVGNLEIGQTRFVNLSCPDLDANEIGAWLDAWIRACGRKPELVVLGLDFFNSSRWTVKVPPDPTADYLSRARGLARKLAMDSIVSWQATKTTLELLGDPEQRAKFERPRGKKWKRRVQNWAKHTAKIRKRTETDRIADIECRVAPWRAAPPDAIALAKIPRSYRHKGYYDEAYAKFELDPATFTMLHRLRRDHPDLEFVPLVTPESTVLLSVLVANGNLDALERFFRGLVAEFGSVMSFMHPSSITADKANFRDENHLHPRIADAMVLRATGLDLVHGTLAPPDDFGIAIDADTIDEYIERWRAFEAGSRIARSDQTKRPTDTLVVGASDAASLAHRAGSRWDRCTWIIPNRSALEVRFTESTKAEHLELSVDGNDTYTLAFRRGRRTIAELELPRPPRTKPGLRIERVPVPEPARRGFDAIRISAEGGDLKFSVGHLRVE